MEKSKKQQLLESLPQQGEVVWIGVRTQKRVALKVLDEVEVSIEGGLSGDHYGTKSGKRQVTLIQAEHLEVVAKLLGKDAVSPQLTRRNIVVRGINLLAFADRCFRIGEEVVLEMTGACHPCSRMEENLGAGGYNAMRGHGGITARVIRGGVIKKGDKVNLAV